jgi:XTP/dITP diphosphohydrolase
MKEFVLCTFNTHKADEFRTIFGDSINIETLHDISFDGMIEENGTTFVANSMIKCQEVYQKLGKPVMADDSGLCVDALGGEPGIYSARYGREDFDDLQRNKYLLSQMVKGNDLLDASFVCALTLYINPNRIYVVQEELKGRITFTPSGNEGFGYDPIFFLSDFGKNPGGTLHRREKPHLAPG